MKTKQEYTTISLSKDLKRKMVVERAKNGYDSWEKYLEKVVYVLKKFKPEMENNK